MQEQQMIDKIRKTAKEMIIDTISSFFEERIEYVAPNDFINRLLDIFPAYKEEKSKTTGKKYSKLDPEEKAHKQAYAENIRLINKGCFDYDEKSNIKGIFINKCKDCFEKDILFTNDSDAFADSGVKNIRYWYFAPGKDASMWDDFYAKGIMAIGWDYLGNLTQYPTKESIKAKMREINGKPNYSYMNDGLATWQFCHDIKVGDIVYAKKGVDTIIGRGVVTSSYEYDPNRKEYRHIHKVNWTHDKKEHVISVNDKCALKTLTDITPYPETTKYYEEQFNIDSDQCETVAQPDYTKEDFLSEVYMSEEDYNSLVSLLEYKKNIILQGAPGVGKTFAAKRLAYSIIKKKDPSLVKMVQFHQSYSYEDFVRGYRPTDKGFEIKNGPFYEFCKKAEEDSENKYFFIIDEINRGNLSKIFGELFMLIEADKRADPLKDTQPSVQLLYRDPEKGVEEFSIPSNLYIIGMMNTADRSLALMDFALRRRFGFFDLKPAFENHNFEAYKKSLNSQKFERLINTIKAINEKIEEDTSLGSGFCIGHSFFCGLDEETNNDDSCNVDIDTKLESIVKYEIKPLLQEYWFDDAEKVKNEVDKLMKVLGSNE